MPISYTKLFELLKEKGYTTYKIRQEKLIGQGLSLIHISEPTRP